jgi:hypothetical protein
MEYLCVLSMGICFGLVGDFNALMIVCKFHLDGAKELVHKARFFAHMCLAIAFVAR